MLSEAIVFSTPSLMCALCLQAGSAAADAAGSNPAAVLSGVGLLNVRGSLSGSHVAPTTRLEWAAPSSGITGSAVLSPTSATVSSSGLGFSIKASATTSNPTAEQARNANTQVGTRAKEDYMQRPNATTAG